MRHKVTIDFRWQNIPRGSKIDTLMKHCSFKIYFYSYFCIFAMASAEKLSIGQYIRYSKKTGPSELSFRSSSGDLKFASKLLYKNKSYFIILTIKYNTKLTTRRWLLRVPPPPPHTITSLNHQLLPPLAHLVKIMECPVSTHVLY